MDLTKLTEALSAVPGVQAIALGGSRSRGEADERSDYDLGLYYDAGSLDVAALDQVLTDLDDLHRGQLLNPPGVWGPWINGGAWLTVDGVPVDILLRDLARVEAVLNDCVAGTVTIDYQAGHPFGFVNAIYAAETHYCKPLWQSEDEPLARLKACLYFEGPYPPKLRRAMVSRFVWEAWFSLACGRTPALKGELNYAMGSVFRTVSAWCQALYALNGRYLMNEKGALPRVGQLERVPANLERRVALVYQQLAAGSPTDAYEILDALHGEIERLVGELAQIDTTIR